MIRVIGKYGVEVGDKCFTIGKVSKQTNKNTGETSEVLTNPGYYTSLAGSLEGIRKRMQLEALKDLDGTLEAAVEAVKAVDARFEALIGKITF